MRLICIMIAATALVPASRGYRILAMLPEPFKSHDHLAQGVLGALLKAGHEVTWVTPFPNKPPQNGLSIIDVSETQELMKGIPNLTPNAWNMAQLMEFARNVTVMAARNPGVLRAMQIEQFDAVISEVFFTDLPAGFAAVLQVPWIVLSVIIVHSTVEALVHDVYSAPMVPTLFSDSPMPMTLWQRMANTATVGMAQLDHISQLSADEKYYKEHFEPMAKARGVVLPAFADAASNISILLVNSHPSLVPAVSLPPNVVNIAGCHIADHFKPLPQDLQEIMDNSEKGVIFFSLGSIVRASGMPEHTRRDLLRIFGALPYTVLWKFEEPLEGLPKNVHVRPWLPQLAILTHPKTKLFITHAGYHSSLEAVHTGMPILAMPVYGDQPANALRAERAGYGLTVPYSADMGSKLEVTLNKMLSDDSYYKKAKELSKLFNNRPVPPAKLITHYVELAIESKGALHLRSPTYLYKWYERYMLDQLAVVLVTLYVLFKLIKFALKMALNSLLGNTDKKIKKN